ncbi:MAG: hypothetical protein KC516_01700 [Nanoarchaeota archaeon]|nr:hypothetical protein [Nanoarchaeota archaeon]
MTEKQYAPSATEKKVAKKTKAAAKPKEIPKVENKKKEEKPEEKKPVEEAKPTEEKKPEETPNKKEEKKKTTPKIKKDYAVVNGKNIKASTKDCIALCRFIKYKKITDAIAQLEEVAQIRRAVPMKGEIPHRKGRIMSGRFPKNASKEFIVLLKSLQGNANMNDIEEPIITEAMSNQASRPFGRFGLKKKRSHVKIVARNKEKIKKKK